MTLVEDKFRHSHWSRLNLINSTPHTAKVPNLFNNLSTDLQQPLIGITTEKNDLLRVSQVRALHHASDVQQGNLVQTKPSNKLTSL